jgi:hypothetical protein
MRVALHGGQRAHDSGHSLCLGLDKPSLRIANRFLVEAALGIAASTIVGLGFLALVAIGVLLVAAYGFEVALVHSDLGFALAWGAFPVVATGFAVGAPPLPTSLAALGAALLSLAQRRLSTPVRALRRRAVAVSGEIRYRDGSTHPIDAPTLIAVPERALRLLWLAAAPRRAAQCRNPTSRPPHVPGVAADDVLGWGCAA